MEKTRIEQDSVEVTLADGSTTYQITSTVTNPGILPNTGIFVFKIVDPAEPKDDVFERVGQPKDINFMLRDRDEAIAASDEEYLYFRLVKQYPDLEIAIQAKAAIKSRIDASIKQWYLYQTEFVGIVDSLHPGTDPEYEQALENTYLAAKAARVAAEDEVANAEVVLDATEVLLAHAEEIAGIRKDEADFCAEVNGVLWPDLLSQTSAFTSAAGTLFTDSKSFWLSSNTFKDDSDTFYGASSTFLADILSTYSLFAAGLDPISPPNPGWPASPGATPAWIDMYNVLFGYAGKPAAYDILVTAYETLVGGYGPYTTPATTLGVYQVAVDGPLAASVVTTNSITSALGTFCGAATAAYSAALVSVSQKETNVATAVSAKNEAEAELASAQEAEDAALAALQECCPGYTV